jgi:hypothetical protein
MKDGSAGFIWMKWSSNVYYSRKAYMTYEEPLQIKFQQLIKSFRMLT